MASRLHLDTHAVVWLHQGDLTKFGRQAIEALEKSVLLYSPIVLLEIQFLKEIGRLTLTPANILADLRREIGLEASAQPYLEVIAAACQEGWTGDPFDRTIVAQARLDGCSLLSRDRKIQENYSKAFW